METNEEMLGLNERMAKVEGILEQVSDRLNHLEARMASLEDRLDSSVKELRAEMSSHFKWTLGLLIPLIITMWVSMILAILFGR